MTQNYPNNKLPSFLVIGTGKSGTTSLHEYLRQHPRISLPKIKETHFFVLDKSSPSISKFEHDKPSTGIDKLKNYFAEFETKGVDEIRGEVCPSYMFNTNAPVNIKKYVPGAKIIAILRNPIERLYSSVNFNTVDNDLSKFQQMINAALQQTDNDIQPHEIREGFYFQQLKQYYDLFPNENIKIYLFEEFIINPNEVLADILGFIGLSKDFVFNVSYKLNPSGKPKMPFLAKLIRNDGFIKKFFRKTISDESFQFLRIKYQSWMYKKAHPLSLDLRRSILSLYSSDIVKLERLIKRDLSHWQNIP